MSLNRELDLDLDLALLILWSHIFDCFQADGSVQEISYNDPEFLPEDRFSESVDEDLFVWLVGFLTSSSTTRLYRGRAPRQSV